MKETRVEKKGIDCTGLKVAVYDNIEWTLCHASRFRSLQKYGKRRMLHQYVWEQSNGEITGKRVIHHIDMNHQNNLLSNLECITQSEHVAIHNRVREYSEETRKNISESLKGRHLSEEHKRKIGQAATKNQTGRKLSKETKKRIGEGIRRAYANKRLLSDSSK